MRISIGSVVMGITKTVSIQETPVRTEDNADYVMTKWIGTFICWYNPSDTSFAGNTVAANAQAGRLPALTDAAIQEYLAQPRRRVIVQDELGNVILDEGTPIGAPMTTDTKNGPFVENVVVNQVHGVKSWEIHLTVTVYRQNDKRPGRSPLLAHRWTQWIDYDEDSYAVRVTEGTAIFRTDDLLRLGRYPDQYRRDLFFAIPNNFKRENVHVEALPDGSGVRYRVIDAEKALNLHNRVVIGRNVSRIEAYQTGGYTRESQAVAEIAGAAAVAAAFPNPLGMLAGLGKGFGRYIPRYNSVCIVNVWGNRLSTRAELAHVALAVARARLGDNNQEWKSTSLALTYDLMNKFVRLEMKFSWGIEQIIAEANNDAGGVIGVVGGLIGNLLVNLGPAPAIPAQNPNDHPTLGTSPLFRQLNMSSRFDATGSARTNWPIGDGDVANLPPSAAGEANNLLQHPPPPRSSGTRGSSLAIIVHQELTRPWAVPAQPFGVVAGNEPNAAGNPTLTNFPEQRLYP